MKKVLILVTLLFFLSSCKKEENVLKEVLNSKEGYDEPNIFYRNDNSVAKDDRMTVLGKQINNPYTV